MLEALISQLIFPTISGIVSGLIVYWLVEKDRDDD